MNHLTSIESENLNNKQLENVTSSLVIFENGNIIMPILNNLVLPSIELDLNFIIGTCFLSQPMIFILRIVLYKNCNRCYYKK